MQKHLVVLCAVLGVAFAAVALGKPEPKPDKYKDVEGCYIGELDAVIPLGESRPSTSSCMEFRCSKELVQYVSCGLVHVAPPHKLVQDLSRPYPECCPKVDRNIPADPKAEKTNKV